MVTGNQTSTGSGAANHKNSVPAAPSISSQGTNAGTGRNNSTNSNSHFRQQQQNQSSRGPCGNTATTENSGSTPARGQTHQLPYSDYRYDQQRGTQPQTRFDERLNQRYSPPVYPPTPSINTSFPGQDALSCSLIQIAENQTRSINALLASQQSQVDAYKEMARSNKMRDDALFESTEVYDGSNPSIFKCWLDNIDVSPRGTSGKN